MRSFLIATALLCTWCGSYAQDTATTAFYDAISIMKWHRLTERDSAKRARQADTILTKLLQYADYDNRKLRDVDRNIILHQVYLKADSIYSYTRRQELPRQNVLDKLDTSTSRLSAVITRLRNEYRQAKRDSAAVYNALMTYAGRLALDDTTGFGGFIHQLRSSDSLRKFLPSGFDTATMQWSEGTERTVAVKELMAAVSKAIYKIKGDVQAKGQALYLAVMGLNPASFRALFNELRITLAAHGTGRPATNDDILQWQKKEQRSELPGITLMTVTQAIPPAPSLIDLNFPTQSDIIDAIAIYLVRRTKQEAALLFLEKLNKAIASNQLAQELFPNTWTVMQEMDHYSAPRFGARWRNAIATDYIALPQNVVKSEYIKTRIKNKEVYNHLMDAVTFGNYVAKKYSFIDIVNILYNDRTRLKGKWTSIGIDAMQIVNTELRDTNRKAFTWISPARFMSLSTDELHCLHDLVRVRYEDKVSPAFAALMGRADTLRRRTLPYQLFYMELLTMLKQFSDIQNASAKRAEDGTVITSDGFWDAQRTFLDFLLENASIIHLSPRERKGLELCKSAFYVYDYLSNKNYIAAAEHVLTIVSGLVQGNPRQLINLSPKQERQLAQTSSILLDEIKTANQRFVDWIELTRLKRLLKTGTVDTLRLRNEFEFSDNSLYARLARGSIADTANLRAIETTTKYSISSNYKTIRKAVEAEVDGKIAYAFKNADTIQAELFEVASSVMEKENSNFFRWLSDFAGLLTEISATKKSDELANVIESYAMPPGSYRVKRASNFSIDLNAYTGFYVGAEHIQGGNKYGAVYGFTAPVGFAFTWGFSKRAKPSDEADGSTYLSRKGWLKRRSQSSLTLDLSVIDIGAVVSYRFSGEEKGLPNKVSWDQVLSLGANLRYGIKSTPFCVGIGVQRSPKLRTVKDLTTGQMVQKDVWRGQLTATFDLPLLNIYRSF